MADNTKKGLCFSMEESYVDKLKHISKTKGPSSARIVENAIAAYLKGKEPAESVKEEKKIQMCFYPTEEMRDKMHQIAKEEGRSVSSLVSYIVKEHLKNMGE